MVQYKTVTNHGCVCFGVGNSTLCVPIRVPKTGYCPFEEDEVTVEVYDSIDEYANEDGNALNFVASVMGGKLVLYKDDSEVSKEVVETFESGDERYTMFLPNRDFTLALIRHD